MVHSLECSDGVIEGPNDLINHAIVYYKYLFGPAPSNLFLDLLTCGVTMRKLVRMTMLL